MNNEEIKTLPITGWEMKTVPALDALLISFSYLSHSTQKIEEAVTDRTYVMHTAQARELAQKILSLCEKQAGGAPHGAGVQKH